MAELRLETSELKISPAENICNGIPLRCHAFVHDGELQFSMSTPFQGQDIFNFYLGSIADIDALRTYCEMALNQFKSGILVE